MAQEEEAKIIAFLRLLVELGGLLSIVLYGLSWIFVVHLFDRFEIAPEDVGITAQWLIVRSTTTAVPLAVIAAIIFSDEALRYIIGTRGVRIVQLSSLASVLIFMPIWYIYWKGNYPNSTVFITVAFCLSFVVFMFAVLRERSSSSRSNRRLMLVSAIVFLVATTVYPWNLSDVYADDIRAGTNTSIYIIPGFTLIQLTHVDVLRVNENERPTPLPKGCATLLGSANGITVLFLTSDQSIWHLSTQEINLRHC